MSSARGSRGPGGSGSRTRVSVRILVSILIPTSIACMSPIVDPAVEAYAEAHTTPPEPHLAAVAEETRAQLAAPQMLTGLVEGRFLEMLVFAQSPRLVLELGTFSG